MTRARTLYRVCGGAALCAIVLLAAGCSGTERELTCLDDDECASGEACIDGRCVEVQCRNHDDCPQGSLCREHECVLVLECETSSDCDLGFVCIDGFCVEGCVRDNQCPAGLHCLPDEGDHGLCAACADDGHCPGGRCDPVSHTCVACLQSADCPEGQMCRDNACLPGCDTDADCPAGLVCRDNQCLRPCATREDCADDPCGVCVDGVCRPPPPVCQSDQDCCIDHHCNFGSCVPDSTCECSSDADCPPELPRCVACQCVGDDIECMTDIDCPVPGEVCIDHQCTEPACTPASCPQGQWCDPSDGKCKDGCDEDADCMPPARCNLATHTCGVTDCCNGCGTGTWCDTLTCQCVESCKIDDDCPKGYTCAPDGSCSCTPGACPPYTACDQESGRCRLDKCGSGSACPPGWQCDPATSTCQVGEPGPEGGWCFRDEDCDQQAGLLCDSATHCLGCRLSDPDFAPTFACLYECSLLMPQCPSAGYQCLYRHPELKGLCLPP